MFLCVHVHEYGSKSDHSRMLQLRKQPEVLKQFWVDVSGASYPSPTPTFDNLYTKNAFPKQHDHLNHSEMCGYVRELSFHITG